MALVFDSIWGDLLLLDFIILSLVYLWVKNRYTHWMKKNVPGPEPSFFVGNFNGLMTLRKTIGEVVTENYLKTKDLPYAGIYMLLRPALLVNDLDLAKRIMVKDFAHFTDHPFEFDHEKEPLAANLFNLRGEKWKNLRLKLTPTFTTSRMKQMYATLESVSQVMMEHLETQSGTIDVKEVLAKYTTDVIGNCAFGIECNSFEDPDARFRTMGKKIFHLSFFKTAYQLLSLVSPSIMKNFHVKIQDEDTDEFFLSIVKNSVEYREKNNIVRNDFLQLLMQLKNEGFISDDKSGDCCNCIGFWYSGFGLIG